MIPEQLGQLLLHLLRLDRAHHHEGEIVGHVTRFVILHHLLLRELVENIEQADDGQAIGMPLIGGGEKKLARHAIRIVEAHREFAPDHFLFLGVFLGRQGRVHHRIGQDIERRAHARFRDIDPINRAIERRVGIDVTAHVLDRLRDRVRRAVLRSFEKHVLEDVRQARAEVRVLIHAPGAAPSLHARDRRALVFLHDDGEAVRQNPFPRGGRRESDHGRSAGGGALKMSGCEHMRKGTPRSGVTR